MSYKRSEDKEEVEMVLINNENNNNDNDVVSDFRSHDEAKENLFEEQVDDKIKVTPKTTLSQKMVHAVKNLQAFYNEDVKNH